MDVYIYVLQSILNRHILSLPCPYQANYQLSQRFLSSASLQSPYDTLCALGAYNPDAYILCRGTTRQTDGPIGTHHVYLPAHLYIYIYAQPIIDWLRIKEITKDAYIYKIALRSLS